MTHKINSLREQIKEEVIERFASIEHECWKKWAITILKEENISEERKKRWKKCFVPYDELDEETKEDKISCAQKLYDILEREGIL